MLVVVAACRADPSQPAPPETKPVIAKPVARDASVSLPTHREVADLATALRAVIPADARVIGFGELHSRTDRAQVTSALSRFTSEGLPAIADQLSDLIVETWVVDGKCGSAAQTATAKVAVTMRRPAETKSEIAVLADTARKANIQPHAMRITCADYDRIAPAGKEVQPEEMLSLTTRELGRITTEVIAHRDAEAGHPPPVIPLHPRPWIAVYGGALHNDRMPAAGVEDWSYAAKADKASKDHFVEVDLMIPELAEADPASQKEPWFPLVAVADSKVRVWQRGERSFVIVLSRTSK
ncbi:MAG: hypothetical protein JWO36_3492 [Myxococcales bacterium]|nr:hypothetical protein [Myxococcales bacterium]